MIPLFSAQIAEIDGSVVRNDGRAFFVPMYLEKPQGEYFCLFSIPKIFYSGNALAYKVKGMFGQEYFGINLEKKTNTPDSLNTFRVDGVIIHILWRDNYRINKKHLFSSLVKDLVDNSSVDFIEIVAYNEEESKILKEIGFLIVDNKFPPEGACATLRKPTLNIAAICI